MAGEGCFSITTKLPAFANGDPRLRFVFAVAVASRDRPLLEILRARLGCGSLVDAPPRRAHWQPITTLSINSLRAHHAHVIPWMEKYLLAGEKRHQFELWRTAMDSYESYHPTRWGKGPSTCWMDGCEKPIRGRGLCRSHYYRETGW